MVISDDNGAGGVVVVLVVVASNSDGGGCGDVNEWSCQRRITLNYYYKENE